MQFRIATSYILIIVAVLILLNTYPLLVSENLVFQSKQSTLQNSVSVLVSGLSGLDMLGENTVEQAITVAAEKTGASRILVTDQTGRVVYDSRETGNAMGSYALYTEIAQALEGNDAFYSAYHEGAFRSRAASPVVYRSRIIGAVYAYDYDTEQAVLLSGLQKNLHRISIVTALAVLALSVAFSKLLTVRFSRLLESIRIVREGNYSHRTALRGHDEIADIGREFNRLTDRLQITESARRRFVADASHELKTPLASIRLLSDSILENDEVDPGTVREFVGDIRSESERLERITQELLRLTMLDNDEPIRAEAVNVATTVGRVVHMLRLLAEEKEITLSSSAGDPCWIRCAEDDLYQILYNLAENGIKYNRAGGFVHIDLCRNEDDTTAVLTVADNGIGIPEEELPKIFERFYRVDKARSRAAGGTGLGLSIVCDTVRRYGGTIVAENRPGGGALFTVRFPLCGEGEVEP